MNLLTINEIDLVKAVEEFGLDFVIKKLTEGRSSQKKMIAGVILSKIGKALVDDSREHCINCDLPIFEAFGQTVKISTRTNKSYKHSPEWVAAKKVLTDIEKEMQETKKVELKTSFQFNLQ